MMNETCIIAESVICYPPLFIELRALRQLPLETTETVASSAVSAAHEQQAGCILVLSTSGNTARLVSKYRPMCPIVTVTRIEQTARQIHLYRGCYPFIYDKPKDDDWQVDVENRISWGINRAVELGILKSGERLIAIQGWKGGMYFSFLLTEFTKLILIYFNCFSRSWKYKYITCFISSLVAFDQYKSIIVIKLINFQYHK
jgi:pyruvate kinase